MATANPSIFHYTDFRKFLGDLQKWKQGKDKGFNKSNLSKLLGLPNTRSYFTDVLSGRRVSDVFIERFVGIFGLTKGESKYFRALVKMNQAENTNEREIYFDQIISLNRTPKKILDQKIFEYYKNWYNGTVRALLNIIDFKDDYPALAKKVFPPITPKEVKNSIQLLRSLELIAVDVKGFLRPTDKAISTPDYIKDEVVRQYQINSLELAKWCILKNPDLPQVIATNVISVSQNGYKKLEKKIQSFRSEINALVHNDEDHAEKVYHFDILLFPNSK